MNYRTETIK